MVSVSYAREAWIKFTASYAAESKTQVRNIKANFYQLKKEQGETIAQYTQKAKGIMINLLP